MRRHAGMGIADALRLAAGGRQQQRFADQGGGDFACGDIDMGAFLGGAAAMERGHHRARGIHADRVVHDVADLDRRAVLVSGQLAKSAPGAEQWGIAGEMRIRAALAGG